MADEETRKYQPAEPRRGGRKPSFTGMLAAPPAVAGYQLLRVLGKGGMGVVWEAIEHRLVRRVALKLVAGRRAEDVARAWSEARLAASISDPGVVAIHDFGYAIDGTPYYTMDLVEGTDLSSVLDEGPIPQQRALALAIELARAVGAAHERGIVHRDLKPSNVLVDSGGRLRILDFGIAFAPAEGVDPFQASGAGSPLYMAPEQVAREPVGPATDVHALGVILYELLTDAHPFAAATSPELLLNILERAASPPSIVVPSIPPELDLVVLRCLEKKPEARFANARVLASVLTALAEGRPIGLDSDRTSRLASVRAPARAKDEALSPRKMQASATLRYRWSWTLRASPSAMWPLVANTERLNKAAGLQPVIFTDALDDEVGSKRTGEMKALLGIAVRWREFPFEWVVNREHAVFRQYDQGPLAALWNHVVLSPTPDGGTELVHEIAVIHRGVFGRLATWVEIERKLRGNLDRVYRALDEFALNGESGQDPFEPQHNPSDAQRRHVHAACQRLLSLHAFDPNLIDRLAQMLLREPEKRIERIRPHALAAAWKADRLDVLELLLHSASAGLLEISWDIVCPSCMTPHETCDSLSQVTSRGTCVPCAASFARDLGESVELVFRPHSEVREVTLSTYCVGSPALRPHVLSQQLLDPGEERTFEVDLPAHGYRLVTSPHPRSAELLATPTGFAPEVEVFIDDDSFDVRPRVVRAGPVRIRAINASAHERLVRLEITGTREDVVTASTVMTNPAFHDFFSSELLASGELLSVSRLAFLFFDVADRPSLLEQHGDAGTASLFRLLDEVVSDEVRTERGVIIPSAVDAGGMAFASCVSAVRAALAIAAAARKGQLGDSLRLAVHEGPCLALTRDGRTEWFGKTLHRVSCLLEDAPLGGIALSTAVDADRDVAILLEERAVRVEVGKCKSLAYAGLRVTRVLPPQ